MDRQVIKSAHSPSSPISTTAKAAQQHAPWWQLYSVLIVTIGAGIVAAVNDPALLHNPIVLLAGIVAFFGFVLVWCNKHDHEIEAEPWQSVRGQINAPDESAPTSISQTQDQPRSR